LRDSPQYGQGSVALHRVLFQFFCNVLSTFMVTPVWEDAAIFFQHSIHIGDSTLIQFTHGATSPGATVATSFASNSQRYITRADRETTHTGRRMEVKDEFAHPLFVLREPGKFHSGTEPS
jgi:hypothetical protein